MLPSKLLIEVLGWCDAPSLVQSARACKAWRDLILDVGSQHLFRNFQMEGYGAELGAGPRYLGGRCNNSIQMVEIGITGILNNSHAQKIRAAILASSQTLKVLSSPQYARLVIPIAVQCPLLSTLICNGAGPKNGISANLRGISISGEVMTPSLRIFEWTCGNDLKCNDTLIKLLQFCREVNIWSDAVSSSWLIELLLVAVGLESCIVLRLEADEVKKIPFLNLPALKVLKLGHGPLSRQSGNSSLFFQNLHAPRLERLSLVCLYPSDLSSLRSRSQILRIQHFPQVNSDPASGAAVASELVDAIKDWKLEELGLATATRSTLPSSFWNRIAEELTPLSVRRVQAGYRLGTRTAYHFPN